MKFQRSIGSLTLWLSAVGSMIGSGWLFGALYAARLAGPAAVIAWILGGVLMLFIAFTFAELSTAFPVAGGMVQFAEYSHGPLLSFTIGWMVWLSSVVVAPVEALAMLQYAGAYIPGLVHKVGGATALTELGTVVAIGMLFLMCVLNWHGAAVYGFASNFIVFIKFVVPILTVLVLLSVDFHSSNFYAVGGFAPFGLHGILAALPLGGVVFSFMGYNSAIQLAEEAKNPQRAMPIALLGSLLFCIILYVALQLTFIGALKPEFLSHGWQKLSFTGDSGPFAGILITLGITWLVMVIYADAIISPFGTGYIYSAATARVNYAMGMTGFFPEFMKKINRYGVPMNAIWVNFFVGLMLFLPFRGWQSMVGFIVTSFVVSYSIGPLALITLRHTHPNQPRPFRVPYVHPFSFLAFYACNLLVFWAGWNTIYRLLIGIAVGLIVFLFRRNYLTNIKNISHWQTAFWLFPYLIGLGIISYLGSFSGGKNIIPFGMDFLVIAIFTLIIYFFAVRAGKKAPIVTTPIEY
ncbi:MAG: APC family permease [Gammaproteobacteria bacterium]